MVVAPEPFRQVPDPLTSPDDAAAEKRMGALSLGVAFVLMGVKFVAYGLTGSAAIFSDALESIVNVLASGFALFAIILTHRPADQTHPYGHGKVEFLAAGFEGGMILLAALVIAWRSVESIVHGPQLHRIDTGLLLILVAMVVNGGVGVALIRIGKRNGSITLEADGKHLLTDAVTSVAVLVSLLVVRVTGWVVFDPIGALLVASYLVWIAVDLLRRSAAGLMDAQDAGDDAALRQILDSHLAPHGRPPLICGYHNLRHRHTGRYHWVDFHLHLPATLDVARSHEIASEIEGEIERVLGPADATAHVEPCTRDDCNHLHLAPPGAGVRSE
ncbi:MAG: cation diffusion facilitator family transporter [Phycisphaerae bacterium]|nr:cation diffusion facilitator family transporter [Phycisphaerae bacterium]